MRGILLAILSSTILLVPASALAVGHTPPTVATEHRDSGEAEATGSASPSAVDNISARHFVVTGTVAALTTTSLTVNGQTIFLDPTKVHQIVENGTIKVGSRIHVEGVVLGGKLYAQEVNIQGGEEEATTSTTSSAYLHTIVRVGGATTSATPTASSSAALTNLTASLQSATHQLTSVLDQILSFLHQLFY